MFKYFSSLREQSISMNGGQAVRLTSEDVLCGRFWNIWASITGDTLLSRSCGTPKVPARKAATVLQTHAAQPGAVKAVTRHEWRGPSDHALIIKPCKGSAPDGILL